jgi:hypothetical protein
VKLDAYGSVQGPVVGCREPSGSIKGGKFLDCVTISFSTRTLLHGVSEVCSTCVEFYHGQRAESLWKMNFNVMRIC